jgi:hypothetical protein
MQINVNFICTLNEGMKGERLGGDKERKGRLMLLVSFNTKDITML